MIKKALTISAGMFALSLLAMVVMILVFIWTDKLGDVHFKIMGTIFLVMAVSGLLTAAFGQAEEYEQKTKGDA